MTTLRNSLLMLAVASLSLSCGVASDRTSRHNRRTQLSNALSEDASFSGRKQSEKAKKSKDESDDPSQNPGNQGKNEAVSETSAFAQTLHPLLIKQCGVCHANSAAPLFSQKDAEASRLAVLDTGKVNFSAVDKSRIFLRLSADNHNCWGDCDANAAEVKDAIDEWLSLLLTINPKFLEEQTSTLITKELSFSNAETRNPIPDPLSVVLEAESGTVTAPMQLVNDAKASNGSYIEVPNGNGGTINNANQNNAGGSLFNITVPTAGDYKVWALINSATDANNAFFIRVDNGAFNNWATPVTAGKWEWSPANAQDGLAELKFTLTAGAHTLEIKRRDVATKIDQIAVTSNLLFDGTQADKQPIKVLRYDISDISGKPNTFFEIEVSDFSEAAWKFRKPAIVSTEPLSVKGIKILINGQYSAQHNTYNLIDTKVTPPRTEISRAAMIVLKEQGTDLDKISFSFEAIQ